jgi:hypothetical protein
MQSNKRKRSATTKEKDKQRSKLQRIKKKGQEGVMIAQIQILQQEIDQLIKEKEEQQQALNTAQKQSQVLTENINSFLTHIPKNNKAHSYSLQIFSKGIELQTACELFHVCPATMGNVAKLPSLTPPEFKKVLHWKGTRNMISSARMEVLIDVLDEEIPVVSGRDYCIRYCWLRVLYECYVQQATVKALTLAPIGYGKFKKILKTQRVHNGKKPFLCEHCTNNNNGEHNLFHLVLRRPQSTVEKCLDFS